MCRVPHNPGTVSLSLSLSLRRAPSKQLAGAVCFFFSAVFHELIIGLPLRGVRVPLAFVAMMAQAPPAHQP